MDEKAHTGVVFTELYVRRYPQQVENAREALLTKRLKGSVRRPFLSGGGGLDGEALRPVGKTRRRSIPLDPLARYEYMFAGPHAGLLILRGWTAILAHACEEIEHLVAIRKLQFHWVSLQEEDGAGRFIYAVNDRARFQVDLRGESRRAFTQVSSDVSFALGRRIDAITCEAERLTLEACVVCGVRCSAETYFGHQLPLCQRHKPDLLNEPSEVGLEGVWRCAVERDVAPRAPWV